MQENVYISITGDKRQLTIDGDLSLFDRLLATLRGNKQQTEQHGLLPTDQAAEPEPATKGGTQ